MLSECMKMMYGVMKYSIFYPIESSFNQSVKNKFLFTMTAYQGNNGLTALFRGRTTLSAQGFDPATFQSLAQCSNHQATCRPLPVKSLDTYSFQCFSFLLYCICEHIQTQSLFYYQCQLEQVISHTQTDSMLQDEQVR